MIAKRFDELLAWQLMHELSVEMWQATARRPTLRDFKFSAQIRDASDSPARNIAEGFGRFNPTEFARFLDIARGPTPNETPNASGSTGTCKPRPHVPGSRSLPTAVRHTFGPDARGRRSAMPGQEAKGEMPRQRPRGRIPAWR